MLLGHWYLTQPGLPRVLLNEMVDALKWLWPAEVFVMLLPTGMIAVLTGSVDDGWGGMLGWMWVMCAIDHDHPDLRHQGGAEGALLLGRDGRDRLLYLAILTGFGMDIVPRAILAV